MDKYFLYIDTIFDKFGITFDTFILNPYQLGHRQPARPLLRNAIHDTTTAHTSPDNLR